MFEEVTPGLWVAQSALFHTNSGIWLDGRAAVLIDPGIHPDEIAGVAAFLAERAAMPRAIVLTHSHWDHILGPEGFPGVPVVTTEAYRATAENGRAIILADLEAWVREDHVPRPGPFIIPQPDRTFTDSLTLPLGVRTLVLRPAPGHAPDQLTVYEPESGTLWAADMLSDLEIPYVSHSLEAYRATLAALAPLPIRALVPGHGHATTDPRAIAARLDADRAYLAALHARVGSAVAAGRSLAAALDACADLAYRAPELNADPHRWNVESAYTALGGPAPAQPIGWEQFGPPPA